MATSSSRASTDAARSEALSGDEILPSTQHIEEEEKRFQVKMVLRKRMKRNNVMQWFYDTFDKLPRLHPQVSLEKEWASLSRHTSTSIGITPPSLL